MRSQKVRFWQTKSIDLAKIETDVKVDNRLLAVPVVLANSRQQARYQNYLNCTPVPLHRLSVLKQGVRSAGKEFVAFATERSHSGIFPQHKDGKHPKWQRFAAAAKILRFETK